MMKDSPTNQTKWITLGYRQFGVQGPAALNIERLSMVVGLNRSSFYHYFAEVDIFEKYLLEHHIGRFQDLSKKLDQCQHFDPDFIHLVQHCREELMFHRQLLILESTPRYKSCFNSAKAFTEHKTFRLWAAHLDTQKKSAREFSLFQVVRDFSLLHFKQRDEQETQEDSPGAL